ncbi:polyprenol monophosphomannose synthase [Candidatus Uhrbacteria bacterium]|nr:polyprenol monophosphomannose synthase [Candidatus Uhrbacteria bacterium]
MRTAVVIPTFNERDSIKGLVHQIFALGISELEIIVVDDSSTDGTFELLRILKKRFRVTIISRPRKMGLGSALKDGLSLALNHGAARVITMDGDGSHSPDSLPNLLAELDKGAGVAIGSRRVSGGAIYGWGWLRILMSRGAMEVSRRVLKISARDVTSGLRAYRRKVLEMIDLTRVASTGYAFQEEMLFRAERAGFGIVELPITFVDRRHGKSKLGIRDIVEFFITVARLKLHA